MKERKRKVSVFYNGFGITFCTLNVNRWTQDACPSGRMYELTETGRAMAKRLKLYARTLVESGPLRQLPDTTVDEEFGMVTMSMDFREGGGGGKSLHRYCDELDRYVEHQRVICSFSLSLT